MELVQEVMEKIINKSSELFKREISSMNGDTKFVEDFNIKSVDFVKIIAVLEDDYDLEINFMEFRRKKTILEAATYVANLCDN